jgi:SAM-dependent methyltransferase
MTSYALLVSPSANRVYTQAAPDLTMAELAVLDATVLGGRLGPVERIELAGVAYLSFAGDLTHTDLRHLANVSTAFALFEHGRSRSSSGERSELVDSLRPVGLQRLDCLDDDLLTILKYQGKTNELFTKLLLNVTVASSNSAPRMLIERLRVLDPMCGRGTTLNQALMYGWHAAGDDIDERDFDAYAAFLPTWLKRKRLKHTAITTKLRREGRTLGRRFDAELAVDKEAWAAGERMSVSVALADTMTAPDIFRAASFDAVVTDAPYGVQHGSRSGSDLRRGPLELLADAVPGWMHVLRPGGTIGIAVNTRVSPRADVLRLLADAGLQPLDSEPYRRFEHRVDQAIVRDVVVARKPGRGDGVEV